MKVQKTLSILLTFAAFVCASVLQAQKSEANPYPLQLTGSWQLLKHPKQFPPIYDSHGNKYGFGGAAAPLLLTDGTILIQNEGYYGEDNKIFRLSPDQYGSYVNGTWSQLASKPYISSGAAQAVLADGRVLIEGGEYSNYNYQFLLTNQGAIYNPFTNTWASVEPPNFFDDIYPPRQSFAPSPIGDSASIVLNDGTFMLADKMSFQAALLDLNTMTWTETGTATKNDMNDEEGWSLLPNGEVLTVDCYVNYEFGINSPYPSNPTNSEIYNPATGEWSSAGSTLHTLTDPYLGEMGPAILMPNGNLFAVGSSGDTSIYNTKTHQWSAGPSLPISPQGYQYTVQDGPGVLLPNGHVLIAASGGYWQLGNYSDPPVAFFEFDGQNLIPAATIQNANNDVSGSISLLPLPTGQVLEVDQTSVIEIYTPSNTTPAAGTEPTVLVAPVVVTPGETYNLGGLLLNGVSQACAFGDELQCATNYPLVRITHTKTGHVYYSRTHNHSSMGVNQPGEQTTRFDVPANEESGAATLQVVVNGVASKGWPITVE